MVPADNILFASETYGAVRGVDPETGFNHGDSKHYIDAIDWLSAEDRAKIFEQDIGKVYPRFAAWSANPLQ